ncbi:DUF664 domain-containing protein [uncultured Aquimarina sp.]|uniref:mycothiol transferase n=1 Tax=uncultured Aquimarina sp. TaxID=575652 RepID=UPI00262897FF|nr:DUF664 domain-containing protein [uncultured Aquimarina sp.]
MKISQISKFISTVVLFFSIFYTNAQTKEVEREWVSFQQKIDVQTDEKVKFKLKARVKTKAASSNSVAAIWVSVENKNKEYGFSDGIQDTVLTKPQWTSYEIEGYFDEEAETITFGGYVVSNGTFYFDDFELLFQEEGAYKPVTISNAGFEKKVANDNIPGWLQDVDEEKNILKVKGYTFHSGDDKDSEESLLMILGKDVHYDKSNYIIQEEGFSPQIGTLISMLNNLSNRVEGIVKNLDQRETDHLVDEKANRIGALIMHLAAAEKLYQNLTFENRRFNKEEEEKWQAGLSLGEEAREKFVGKPISYYLEIYKKVRKKTIEELKKRNDAWLEDSWPGSTMNNHFAWFHVMEHQSSHLGQILFLKKRIPEKEKEITMENEIDN